MASGTGRRPASWDRAPRPPGRDERRGPRSEVSPSLTPGQVDGAFIVSPSLRLNHSGHIIALATAAGLPVQAHRKEWVQPLDCDPTVMSAQPRQAPRRQTSTDCEALFSLGVDVGPVGTAGARYVDSILKGTPPSELPVEEVPHVEFALEPQRAAELGIDVPGLT